MTDHPETTEIKTKKMEHPWVAPVISIITVVFFFMYVGVVTFFPFSQPLNMEFVNLAMGWIGGVAMTVVGYYFGSSNSSEVKNKTISDLSTKKE